MLQRIQRGIWRFTGKSPGVHAVAFTAGGRIVLVRLTYADGWRLPGGGRGRRELPVEAVLRELREEIGMVRCSNIEAVPQQGVDPSSSALFVASGVEYQPRRSLEIEAVGEFDLHALPDDTSPRARRWIDAAVRHRHTTG